MWHPDITTRPGYIFNGPVTCGVVAYAEISCFYGAAY